MSHFCACFENIPRHSLMGVPALAIMRSAYTSSNHASEHSRIDSGFFIGSTSSHRSFSGGSIPVRWDCHDAASEQSKNEKKSRDAFRHCTVRSLVHGVLMRRKAANHIGVRQQCYMRTGESFSAAQICFAGLKDPWGFFDFNVMHFLLWCRRISPAYCALVR